MCGCTQANLKARYNNVSTKIAGNFKIHRRAYQSIYDRAFLRYIYI